MPFRMYWFCLTEWDFTTPGLYVVTPENSSQDMLKSHICGFFCVDNGIYPAERPIFHC